MLSRDSYRNDPDRVRSMLDARRSKEDVDLLIEVDSQWRAMTGRLDELRAERKSGSKEIGALYQAGRADEAEGQKVAMAELGEQIKEIEEETRTLESRLTDLELAIPNMLHDSVPIGADEGANRIERTWVIRRPLNLIRLPIGISAQPSASSTSNAPPSSPELASLCCSEPVPSSNAP